VLAIGPQIPSRTCIEANVEALARFAALSQEADLVPIVEPEVMMDGEHPIERHYEVTEAVLHALFERLHAHRLHLEGLLLKVNMILAGTDCPDQASVAAVAEATWRCMRRTVPAAVPGIVFLSGRAGRHARDRAPQRAEHEPAPTVAAQFLLWPRAAGARAEGVGRSGGQRRGGSGGLAAPRALQLGRAVRAVFSGDGGKGGVSPCG
jgi:hypothetical protein